MKQAIYRGIHHISVEEAVEPKAGANDVIVKVMRNGICGSDLHAYNLGGDEIGIYRGAAIGHEFVGEISEVGQNVSDIQVGDHVFVNPSLAKTKPGMLAMAGGLSQYNLVQNAKLNINVFKLDKSLSWDRAVVIEPYAVGIHGKNLIEPNKKGKYIVLGAGPVGLGSASGLIEQGINNVVVVDIDDDRLHFAKKQFGVETINPQKENLYQNLSTKFGFGTGLLGDQRLDIDAVIDCVGIPQYMTDFLAKAKMNAKFVVVALGAQPVTFKPQFLAMNELSFVGSAIYNSQDILEAIKNVTKPQNHFPDIVTAHYPLTQVQEAFERADHDKSSLKVVIDVN